MTASSLNEESVVQLKLMPQYMHWLSVSTESLTALMLFKRLTHSLLIKPFTRAFRKHALMPDTSTETPKASQVALCGIGALRYATRTLGDEPD